MPTVGLVIAQRGQNLDDEDSGESNDGNGNNRANHELTLRGAETLPRNPWLNQARCVELDVARVKMAP